MHLLQRVKKRSTYCKQVSDKAVMLILNTKRDVSKGFTLVELLIVLVVVGILSGLVILTSSRVLNRTRVNADISTVRSLNTATVIYKTLRNLYLNNDVFDDLNNDKDRIQALLVSGQISSAPVPSVSGTSFSWNIASQKWIISGDITPSDLSGYALKPSDFNANPTYIGIFRNGLISGLYKNESPKAIIIPKEMENDFGNVEYVTRIWQDIFKGKGLTSVVIPEGIERIHARAFQNNQLTEIDFPTSINRIDLLAFAGNTLLTKITIGQGVLIENNAFPSHATFTAAYGTPGTAGTYILTGGTWARQ